MLLFKCGLQELGEYKNGRLACWCMQIWDGNVYNWSPVPICRRHQGWMGRNILKLNPNRTAICPLRFLIGSSNVVSQSGNWGSIFITWNMAADMLVETLSIWSKRPSQQLVLLLGPSDWTTSMHSTRVCLWRPLWKFSWYIMFVC